MFNWKLCSVRSSMNLLSMRTLPFGHKTQTVPGKSKPKEQFSASDLIISARAFITSNPQGKKQDETEELLEEEGYFDNKFGVGDINDVVRTLKKITTDLHKRIMVAYAENPTHKYILSNGGMFLLSFAAACGKLRSDANMASSTPLFCGSITSL